MANNLLIKLNLTGCRNILAAEFDLLGNYTSLREVNLKAPAINYAGLIALLENNPLLEKIGLLFYNQILTQEGIKAIISPKQSMRNFKMIIDS